MEGLGVAGFASRSAMKAAASDARFWERKSHSSHQRRRGQRSTLTPGMRKTRLLSRTPHHARRCLPRAQVNSTILGLVTNCRNQPTSRRLLLQLQLGFCVLRFG